MAHICPIQKCVLPPHNSLKIETVPTQWRAQDLFYWGQKKIRGEAELQPKGAIFFSAPPVFFSNPSAEFFSAPPVFFSNPSAEFNSAPGAEQTRGGAKNLIIPRERGKFDKRSMSKPQLTVLFFFTL